MKRAATILAFVVALAFAGGVASGCGGSTKTVAQTGANGIVTTETVPNIHFAKTKFVLHMGLAFGAFHRYIYKPFRSGAFRSGARGRIAAFAKAAAAALFAVHELHEANKDALSDGHLRPLAQRVDGLAGGLGSLGESLHVGVGAAKIASMAGAVGALSAASGGLGVGIKDLAPSL